MSRLLRLTFVATALVATALAAGPTPAEARAGIHYLSVGSTTPNPKADPLGVEPRYLPDASAPEAAGGITFRIYFSKDPGYPPREGNVTVKYTTSGGTADEGVDYTKTAGTATIPQGADHVDVTVPVNNDPYPEDNESFTFTLSSPSNASIEDGTATGTIVNDSADGVPPKLSISDVADVEGNGGTKPFIFNVTLDKAAEQVVKVNWATKDGSAVAPSDYTAKNGTLTFAVGEVGKTVEVPVNGDLTVEQDETFTVELSLNRNAAVAKGTGTGTIQSDDLPRDQITTVPGRTAPAHVRIFDPNGTGNNGFFAYEAAFDGGARVARGDFIGNDGVQEIITSPCCLDPNALRRFNNGRCCFNYSASRPLIRVFSQQGQLLTQWFAYDQNFTGGVAIASGNVDPTTPGDEVITAPGPGGGPHVRVWRIGSQPGDNGFLPVFEVTGYFAYDPGFTGGVNVAVGDVVREPGSQTDPARDEIITTPMAGGGPHVQVQGVEIVNNTQRVYRFGWMAYDPAFRGGLSVAAGNFDSDPEHEVVTGAQAGGGPHVRPFNASKAAQTGFGIGGGFMAYDPSFTGGINVTAGNGSGPRGSVDEIITGAGVGGGPHVQIFTAAGSNLGGFMAYHPDLRSGVNVAYGGGE